MSWWSGRQFIRTVGIHTVNIYKCNTMTSAAKATRKAPVAMVSLISVETNKPYFLSRLLASSSSSVAVQATVRCIVVLLTQPGLVIFERENCSVQGATNPLARRPGATKLNRRASKSNYHLPDSGKWYFYSNFLVSKNSTIHPSTSYPSSKSRSKKAIVPISKKLHRQLASSASSARMQQWHFKPWMPLRLHARPAVS